MSIRLYTDYNWLTFGAYQAVSLSDLQIHSLVREASGLNYYFRVICHLRKSSYPKIAVIK